MNHIPEGASAASPYMVLNDAGAAIDFYVEALGATEKLRMNMPGTDAIMHAELELEGQTIMISQENPDCGMLSAKGLGGSPVAMYIYVADADAAHARALAAGATEEMPVMEMFWGDRMGTVVCPFGYKWSFATHVKDPTPEEMEAGAKAMMEQMAAGQP